MTRSLFGPPRDSCSVPPTVVYATSTMAICDALGGYSFGKAKQFRFEIFESFF